MHTPTLSSTFHSLLAQTHLNFQDEDFISRQEWSENTPKP